MSDGYYFDEITEGSAMSNNPAAILFRMLYEPDKAFAALREKSHAWLPLAALMTGTAAMLYWYFQTVDFAWLADQTIAAKPGMSEEEREAARAVMTPAVMRWSAIGSAVVAIPVVYALYALYYLLAAKFIGSDISYGKWFALAAWASLPRLLVLPLMATQIISSDGRVTMEELSMVTLNFLVFQLPVSHPWAGLANNIDLALLWSVVLTVIGLRVWTGRRLASCITIGVLPVAVVVGLWAGTIALFA